MNNLLMLITKNNNFCNYYNKINFINNNFVIHNPNPKIYEDYLVKKSCSNNFILKNELYFDKKPKISTISVVVKKNNKIYLLICRRGVFGYNYGKIYTQGGSIDEGESPEQAAVRELYEEAGVNVNEKNLKLLSIYNVYKNFYVLYDYFPQVRGPIESCKSEIISDDYLSKKFNVPIILDENKSTTGLVWAELGSILYELQNETYYLKTLLIDLSNLKEL